MIDASKKSTREVFLSFQQQQLPIEILTSLSIKSSVYTRYYHHLLF